MRTCEADGPAPTDADTGSLTMPNGFIYPCARFKIRRRHSISADSGVGRHLCSRRGLMGVRSEHQ
jgi:hypothetical protein